MTRGDTAYGGLLPGRAKGEAHPSRIAGVGFSTFGWSVSKSGYGGRSHRRRHRRRPIHLSCR